MESTALRLTADFGIDELTFDRVTLPDPQRHEVLVAVRAVSLNYRDLMVVTGRYDPNQQRPRVLCSDGAGQVIAVGEAVSRVKPGDRVMANFFPDWESGPPTHARQANALGGSVDGMLSTYVLLPEHSLVVIPEGLSFEDAATLPCAGVTAWNALVSTAAVGPNDTVLVLGTGGVSIFGLQIAKLRSARVIVTSSSDEKLERARAMGADDTVNYRSFPDWDKEVRRLTAKQGVTHVIEVGGNGTLPMSLRSAAVGAQVSVIGVLSDAQQPLDIRQVLGKSLRMQGIYVGSRQMLQDLATVYAVNRLQPSIDTVFPFQDAKSAFHSLKSATHFGKLVVRLP